jgi:hypothetical protein
VQDELVIPYMYGVSGIGAALITRDETSPLRQHIHDFALALITPLGTNNYQASISAHYSSLFTRHPAPDCVRCTVGAGQNNAR